MFDVIINEIKDAYDFCLEDNKYNKEEADAAFDQMTIVISCYLDVLDYEYNYDALEKALGDKIPYTMLYNEVTFEIDHTSLPMLDELVSILSSIDWDDVDYTIDI